MQSTDESDTAGARLASTDRGDPSGTHLILVHGFTQSAASWDPIAHDLRAEHFVSAVDLPGHGRSAAIRVSDLDATAHVLGQTSGRAIYVGYSLGGRVALTLAVQSPELVEALVIVSASPGIDDTTLRDQRRRSDERLADRLSPQNGSSPTLSMDAFLDEWLAQPLFAQLGEETADRRSRLSNSPEGLAHSLRSAGAGVMHPLHQNLHNLEMPVLCLAGESDSRYVQIAQQMSESIGENAHWKTIPGAGHAVPFEQRGAFLGALREFLVGIEP